MPQWSAGREEGRKKGRKEGKEGGREGEQAELDGCMDRHDAANAMV